MRRSACAVLALVLAHAAPALATVSTTSAASAADKHLVRGGPLPHWAQPLAEVAPTSRRDPLVFRLREAQSLVGPVPATLVNQALQVNDASALSAIGQFSITYHPDYQKLILHRIAILRGGQLLDRMRSADIRTLQQEEQVRNGVYHGASTVQLLLDDVRVGDTLWITYTTEGANPVFGKRWSDEFSWDLQVPVELRRLTVLHPRKQPLHWRQLGDFSHDTIVPAVDQVGELERIRFEGRAIEAVEAEPSMPRDYMAWRMLQMSEYDNWHDVASWAAALFPPVASTPALQDVAKRFAVETDPAVRAAAALHWVQDEIRYFSVSIGENSHRPQPPDVVLRRRFGDCKDKAYLLVSLLGQLGIQARPFLVNATGAALPARVTPAPTWFDHVIVGIVLDGKTVYVDPTRTGQKGPLDMLPPVMPGAPALPVDATATALVTLPERDDGRPQFEHVDDIVVGAFGGDATLESRDIYRGEYADSARQRTSSMSARELVRDALAPYEKTYPGLTVVGAPRTVDKADQGIFEIVVRFKLPKPVEQSEERYTLPYTSQVIDGTLGIPNNLVRNFPFAYPRGKYAGRYRLRIVWPRDVRHAGEIVAKTIDDDFLRLQEEYAFRGNYLDYVLDYRLKNDRIAAADLPRLQKSAKQLTQFAEASFRVARSAVTTDVAALSLRDIEVARTRQDVIVWGRELQARKDGKLDDEEKCGMLRDADVMRAVDLPDSASLANRLLGALWHENQPGTAACVADVLFARGEFKDAITAFERANPADADPARATLAWARLHAGDAKGAAVDMLRFIKARNGSAVLNAFDLADAAALLDRSGQVLPPELAARARELPDGPWPRPLLALQAGTLTPDALLAQAEALPGDAGALALDEAWFFIGERRLAGGDRRGARVAFEHVRAHAPIGTRVHARALAELATYGSNDPDTHAAMGLLERGDRKGAIAAWTRAAQRGDAEAQYRLGLAYHFANGVSQDQAAASRWFELAARQQHASASNMRGYYISNGLGGEAKDSVAANDWYLRAAELGDDTAALNLGRIYSSGIGVERNPELAMRYLVQAAETNNLEAQGLLVWRFAEGDGVAPDDKAAAYWAERAGARGDDGARVDFGRFMWVGRGVAKDPELGTRLIREAAERGNGKAHYFMGEAYLFGHGVTRDPKAAFPWFEKAARAGHTFAELQVGLAYLEGKGVARDADQAVAWLERAAADEVAAADVALGNLYTRGEVRPPDLARAARHYRVAAEAGHAEGEWRYARVLRDGKGVPADPALAARWMRKAAEDKVPQAQIELARMYEAGAGVERDDAAAKRHYRDAARGGNCEAMDGLATIYDTGRGVAPNPRMAQVFYVLAARGSGTSSCPEAANKARNMGARLDAVALAGAQSTAAAWKQGAPLPDEVEEDHGIAH
jgi:TPR repeat protein/transglutaminase-like putative cysteine protease